MTLQSQFNRNDVTIENNQTVYDGYFTLHRYQLNHRLFAGEHSPTLMRECVIRGGVTAVLLYDPKMDCVVLLEQFRVGAINDLKTPWLFEIVAGVNEPGETPEQVAIRETQEEAGCQIERLIPITTYYSSPGGSDERVFLFCGLTDASQAAGICGNVEEHEDIRVHVVSRKAAIAAMECGDIHNAVSIIALQWLQMHHHQV